MRWLILLLPPVLILGVMFGEVYIPPQYILHPTGVYGEILLDIRLPTVVASALIGAILAISGAVMQLLFRNPLMDPYVSGTASGGAFGAVLSYFLLAFNLPFYWVAYFSPLVAFVFSMVSTLLTLAVGRRTGVYGMVIGGVVVSYIFSSLVTIMLTELTLRFPQVPPLNFWLLGEIEVVGWRYDLVLALFLSLIFLVGIRTSRMIDLSSVSDDMTLSKGVDPQRFRIMWVILISLAVAFIVSIAGIIGFVGIIVPHIVRTFASGSATRLVPYSGLLGMIIMISSQIVSNGVLGFKIPLTAITSLMASPIIVMVLVKGIAYSGS
ncbi:iron ABC transporter permease [Metallosphaera tengchongensis]|uniref:Iron ABC transporter permease n=1 Tax=Metallosphaera tengchongensis TaxID=1532350 RepID=A0A6N0NV33_9CREN|nr:iron ABC transporter permease [Metallosphaera tengchongensis]QKR00582.1 iron ABC transporter permease [Metallosphaera tengchongensis]